MKKILRERLSIRKAVFYAIVMNALQIVAVVVFALLLYMDGVFSLANGVWLGILAFAMLVVVWGAVLDIGEALSAQKITQQSEMLEEAYGQLEQLNGTLRAQRHDFMNHLQVVFSLMEMQEYGEAREYISRVYGDIRRVGRALRTGIPAVNALLAAKMSDCEAQGILLETEIESNWQELPVPGWEMCRILGNLIDNAIDAVKEKKDPSQKRICVRLDEEIHAYTFSVSNNGAVIPEEIRESIFNMGFTTKRAGRGMGLHIVTEIMKSHGGSISLDCSKGETCFLGVLPKPLATRDSSTT